jgi:hypothetical protein
MKALNLVLPVCLHFWACGGCGTAGSGDGGTGEPASSCPAAPTNQIQHDTNIAAGTTEVWRAAEGTHVVGRSLRVSGSLTIEPCATVLVVKNGGFTADGEGRIQVGTDTGGVVSISRLNPTEPWSGFFVASNNERARLSFGRSRLTGGGANDGTTAGVIEIRSADVRRQPYRATLHAFGLSIDGSEQAGIVIEGADGFDEASGELTIRGAKTFPIRATVKNAGSVPPGAYAGNGVDVISLYGRDIDVDTRWQNPGVPLSPTDVVVYDSNGGSPVLTIEPGVIVQMVKSMTSAAFTLTVGASSTPMPQGALLAVGTPARPIIFRSAGRERDWGGIMFLGHVDLRSQLNHVVIEDTGGFDSTTGTECPVGGGPEVDPGSGAIRFYLQQGTDKKPKTSLRPDLIRNTTFRRAGTNGILPDFYSDGDIDFCSTNVFESVALCNQTPFLGSDGRCPMMRECRCR